MTTIAIIVEWENAILAELGRPRKMLAELAVQAPECASRFGVRFQLIVALNPGDVDESMVHKLIDGEIAADKWPGTIMFLDAEGRHYYDQKNFAARQTDAEYVVFLDSDVVPEAEWLNAIVGAITRRDVDIVGGQTYLDPEGFFGRVFALFWFFPIRQSGAGLKPDVYFFANNVAFSREMLAAYSFPEADAYRGQCTALCERLMHDGHTIWRANDAWVSHPAPNGLSHSVKRAIVVGYDDVYWYRNKTEGELKSLPFGIISLFAKRSWIAIRVIIERSRGLRLGPLAAVGSFFFALCYNFIAMLSGIVSWIRPGLIRNNLDL